MKKYFYVFCAFILVVGLVFSASSCSLFESEETTEETTLPDKQELANSPNQLLTYYDEMLNKAFSVRPAISVERKLDVKDIEVFKRGETEKDKSLEALKVALGQAKNYILTDINNVKIEPNSTEYGQDLSAVLYDIGLRDLDGIESIEFAEKTVKDLDTNEESIEIDESLIIIKLEDAVYPAEEGSKMARLFKELDIEKALEEFEKTEEYLKIGDAKDFDIAYEDCIISFSVDRKTDEVRSITLSKNVLITVPAEGVGQLEAHAEVDISFRLIDTTLFSFDWVDPDAEPKEE